MINKFFVIACFYFVYELLVNGLFPTFTDASASANFDPYRNVTQQFYDMFIITLLLVTFRPRVWPEYFGVGIFDAQEDNGEEI